jgi:POT family proton-dependent oligopeptide transporter
MSAPRDPDRAFFGHPAGLSTLFFTEMWERFSYYGMRAFLIFYMVGSVEHGGRGMSDGASGIVYALYVSSVYMLSLPGGWIADRFLGQRRAVTFGGVGIMLGNVLLALPIDGTFYPGLAVIALGTGLLKPNVSTLVGQLYKPADIRRDAGFTIYYMGINIGAFVAPLGCGFLAQSQTFRDFLAGHGIDPQLCWHIAFGAAAIGMGAGLIQYLAGSARLGAAGLHPTIPTDQRVAARDRGILVGILSALGALAVGAAVLTVMHVEVSKDLIGNVFGIGLLIGAVVLFVGMIGSARDAAEKKRIIAMIPLFLGGVAFFAAFEQAGSTLNIFAERCVRQVMPASYFQAINSTFILFLAPVFAGLWLFLARARKEPSSVNKFAIGMVLTAAAFIVLLPAIGSITEIVSTSDTLAKAGATPATIESAITPLRVSPVFLIALYFFQTTSELCISPVGLSSMSKLAPTRMAGMVMGTWFLATAIGNYLAGRAAGFTESRGFAFLFYTLIIGSLAVAAALFAVAPFIKKMMGDGNSHDTDSTGAAEKPADEPPAAPLPVATVAKLGDALERD